MLSSTKSKLILGTRRFQTARFCLSSLAAWTSFLASTRMIVLHCCASSFRRSASCRSETWRCLRHRFFSFLKFSGAHAQGLPLYVEHIGSGSHREREHEKELWSGKHPSPIGVQRDREVLLDGFSKHQGDD